MIDRYFGLVETHKGLKAIDHLEALTRHLEDFLSQGYRLEDASSGQKICVIFQSHIVHFFFHSAMVIVELKRKPCRLLFFECLFSGGKFPMHLISVMPMYTTIRFVATTTNLLEFELCSLFHYDAGTTHGNSALQC